MFITGSSTVWGGWFPAGGRFPTEWGSWHPATGMSQDCGGYGPTRTQHCLHHRGNETGQWREEDAREIMWKTSRVCNFSDTSTQTLVVHD